MQDFMCKHIWVMWGIVIVGAVYHHFF